MHTYSSIYFHIIFSTKGRKPYIRPSWEVELHKYITGFVKNHAYSLVAIGGMPDHVHLLIRTKPDFNVSDFVRELKKTTHSFISNKFGTFEWQEGYSVFSVSYGDLSVLVEYIRSQVRHHAVYSSEEELQKFYQKNGMEHYL